MMSCLMLETTKVHDSLELNSKLTWIFQEESYIAFSRCYRFKFCVNDKKYFQEQFL
jgi:hypothetical protein